MKHQRLKRELRKEILLLRAQAYRTEIRHEASALAEVLFPPAAAGGAAGWMDSPLWSLLSSGQGRLARWLRWGRTLSRWWPLLKAVLDKGRQAPQA